MGPLPLSWGKVLENVKWAVLAPRPRRCSAPDSLSSDLFAGCSESSLLEWGGDGSWPVRCLGWI